MVYDLTDYVDRHPGGARRVSNECGTDATRAYETEHKQALLAKEGMTRYVIGLLGWKFLVRSQERDDSLVLPSRK